MEAANNKRKGRSLSFHLAREVHLLLVVTTPREGFRKDQPANGYFLEKPTVIFLRASL